MRIRPQRIQSKMFKALTMY